MNQGPALPLRLTIPGKPRTKKNSSRITGRGTHPRLLPSKAWQEWADAVVPQIKAWRERQGLQPIAVDVNCAALFYRDALRGDAVGYYQGLADVLEHAGIVINDKWIVSWDGSRLKKDASRPRVELVLTRSEDHDQAS